MTVDDEKKRRFPSVLTASSMRRHYVSSKRSNLEIHYRDKTDATAKRAFRVQVPMRMLYSTIAVFFVLPLTIFIWRELHFDRSAVVVASGHAVVRNRLTDPFNNPTWMEETLELKRTTRPTGSTNSNETVNNHHNSTAADTNVAEQYSVVTEAPVVQEQGNNKDEIQPQETDNLGNRNNKDRRKQR